MLVDQVRRRGENFSDGERVRPDLGTPSWSAWRTGGGEGASITRTCSVRSLSTVPSRVGILNRVFQGRHLWRSSRDSRERMIIKLRGAQWLRFVGGSRVNFDLVCRIVWLQCKENIWCNLLPPHVTLIREIIEWTKETWDNRQGMEDKARPC